MLTRATSSRDPANQWLVLEHNRIEKQDWKDLWCSLELIAIQAWRPLQCSSSWRLFTQLPSEPVVQHL